MLLYVGDRVKMRKAHPCGNDVWQITFVGADIKMRCEKCGQERGFCAKTPISSCYCRECGGKTELKNMRRVKIWCECGSAYRYHTNIQDAAFDMPCLNCEAPVALEWNENKNRYQPMNSEPPKARRGRK